VSEYELTVDTYALLLPDTYTPFYVGTSRDLHARLGGHISEARCELVNLIRGYERLIELDELSQLQPTPKNLYDFIYHRGKYRGLPRIGIIIKCLLKGQKPLIKQLPDIYEPYPVNKNYWIDQLSQSYKLTNVARAQPYNLDDIYNATP
jgi:hypothetical protein